MKKATLFTLFALAAVLSNAENRSLYEAQTIAQQFLSEKSGQPVDISTMRRVARIGWSTEASLQPYYAFNDTDHDAFVIISGSTLMRPVLAYGAGLIATDTDSADMPEGLRWWLNAISERTTYLEQHPEAAETQAQINATTSAVAPLLNGIEWDQTGVYSLMTPTISGSNCPTGCVATAMAQVIRYYQNPTQGQGSHSYTWTYKENGSSKSKTLSVNFSAQTYDYSLMPKYVSSANSLTTAQKNEVAKLCYHCGVSVDMSYDTEGSGTTNYLISRALIENFGYNSLIANINREAFSYDEWISIIQQELEAGRPVLYGGLSAYEDAGHAFILEGYDTNGRYYINWGWNGRYNAYYDIAVLNPNGYGTGASMMDDGFCENQVAVLNISHNEGEGTYRTSLSGGGDNSFTFSKSSVSKGSSVTIKVNSIYNFSGIDAQGNFGVVLMKDGEVIKKTSLFEKTIKGCDDNGSCYGFNIGSSYTIPSTLSDGTYQAYIYFQPKGSDNWDIIRMPRTKFESYLQFVVSGNTVSISRPKLNRDLAISNWSFDTTTPSTREETLTVDITNKGSESVVGEYYLYLTDPNNKAQSRLSSAEGCLTIAPGETMTPSFVYFFTQTGKWTSKLYFKPWNVGDTTAVLIDGTTKTFEVELDERAGAVLTLNEAPTLTSRSEDGKFYRNSPVTATFNVTNTGSKYKGEFAIWLYTKSSNPSNLTPVAQYEGSASVANDGTAHNVSIDFDLDLSTLNKNVSYFARPYYNNGSEWVLLSNNLYAKVNIYGKDEPSGIAEVMVDEPVYDLRNAQVFNVLGKRVNVPASGQLPKGIYIVDGRKMVIK